jgi:hypothetical protein
MDMSVFVVRPFAINCGRKTACSLRQFSSIENDQYQALDAAILSGNKGCYENACLHYLCEDYWLA